MEGKSLQYNKITDVLMFPWHDRQTEVQSVQSRGITKGRKEEREERCDQGLLAATCKMVHRVLVMVLSCEVHFYNFDLHVIHLYVKQS